MQSMKKRILTKLLTIAPYPFLVLPIMLLIAPYLFVFIAKFGPQELSLRMPELFLILMFTVLIPNMIYAFVLGKLEKNSTLLLFWDMVLKLCNIPIYIMSFIFGLYMAILPAGIVITFAIVILNYALLLSTSMYGVNGLLKAGREKKITKKTAVVNIIMHFIFCVDVISAVTMFYVVKTKEKNQT